MTLGSIYSGAIDAFAYAANIAGVETKWQIEVERDAHRFLKKNYPETKKYFYDEYFEQYGLEPVDIIAGGDPCQPHSNAGNREGAGDHRYRWPFMFNIIKAMRPTWIINENVTGSVSNLVLNSIINCYKNNS